MQAEYELFFHFLSSEKESCLRFEKKNGLFEKKFIISH